MTNGKERIIAPNITAKLTSMLRLNWKQMIKAMIPMATFNP